MAKKVAFYGIFAGLAIIIAVIERMIPMPMLPPGVKLGLANVIIVMMIYAYNPKAAFAVAILRILIVGLLFGNPMMIAYSLSGGVVSFVAMFFAKKANVFGVVGVSVFGGVFHGIAQITVAALLVWDIRLIGAYAPILIIAGVLTGIMIGYTAGFTLTNLKIIQNKK